MISGRNDRPSSYKRCGLRIQRRTSEELWPFTNVRCRLRTSRFAETMALSEAIYKKRHK
jgi:hypothetical protein